MDARAAYQMLASLGVEKHPSTEGIISGCLQNIDASPVLFFDFQSWQEELIHIIS